MKYQDTRDALNGTQGMKQSVEREKMYMNTETGQVDERDGWWYESEEGYEVNAVDLGEVVEVKRDGGEWVEV